MNADNLNINDSIKIIRSKVECFRGHAAKLAHDKTVEVCEQSLVDAQREAKAAAVEDESIEAEVLVDRRIEAARQVEIAQIRLQRAKKMRAELESEIKCALLEARNMVCEGLRAASDSLSERLMAGAVRVFGEEVVLTEGPFFKSLAYRATERVAGTARRIEKSDHSNTDQMIRDIEHAIRLIEESLRER